MKRKKEHRKSLGARLVSLMLAAVMLVTMVPSTAFASPAREEEDVAVAAADGSAVEVRKELTAAPLAFRVRRSMTGQPPPCGSGTRRSCSWRISRKARQ